MRRIAVMAAVPLLAIGVLAGCGSKTSPSTAGADGVDVEGGFGLAPEVDIPATKAGQTLKVTTVIHGHGPVYHSTDSFVGNYAIYLWSGANHKLLQSSFKTHSPTLFSGQLLPGLEKALVGKTMGSRVVAVIPPKDGFGKNGNAQAGITGTDTLVFVVDMIKDYSAGASASGRQLSTGGAGLPKVTAVPGKAPTIKVPSSAPPKTLKSVVLIKGSGPKVDKGDMVVAQYSGVIWRTGKVFSTSWTQGQPFGFTIGANPSQVIPGWDKGLQGQTVGSRVMLVIPPAEGYGKAGSPQAKIKGTDTLVFVVDILGAFTGTPSS
jgi:FKBP-type peptidyl-prolyl cis-trans isomerase